MTVLGKNAALFSGSVRKNLKVKEQFQDAELWLALEQEQEKRGSVGLRVVGEWCKFKYRRTETNLLGSRVAATKQNREPTAHVDPDTERTIWNVVHEKLRDSTVITIAHRLNTIRN